MRGLCVAALSPHLTRMVSQYRSLILCADTEGQRMTITVNAG
ncbi:hypothetical protein SAMN02745157_4673 [Kaistia soli DSM 19436]|uniref:Uncharacterized protein n=1 Tax=Kaistia soli DSM 19436 TaxID=1122133 RepID=A0A1M5M2M2_9HYPH|nr:hypothetical protein SAMN02745157_4673 [Kaistia soli DSM 19436]